MSVYYNVKVKNDNEDPIIFKTNETSFIPILNNQENYEVGVKRFKIPTSEIDFYRLYPQKQVLSTGMIIRKTGGGQIGYRVLDDMFIPETVLKSEYDNDTQTYFNTVTSNEEYCDYLNSCLYRNMIHSQIFSFATLLNEGEFETTTGLVKYHRTYTGTFNVFTNINLASVIIPQEITNGAFSSETVPNQGVKKPRKITHFELNILSMEDGGFGNGSMSLSDITFYLLVLNSDDDLVERIPIIQDLCYGKTINDFNTEFPKGIKISPAGRPNVMSNNNWNNTGKAVHFALPNVEDAHRLFMKYGEYYSYQLFAVSKNQLQDSGFDIDCSLDIYMSNDNFFSVGTDNIPGASHTDEGSLTNMPYFSFDTGLQRIVFNCEYIALKNSFDIFINEGLRNAMGYDCSIIKNTPLQKFGNTADLTNANLRGGFIKFTNEIITDDTTPLRFIEQQNSVFKRNYLYSLIITADSLAINGEFEGDGRSQRKILSDFEIDPGLNFRDYLVYQPTGNSVRYYKLNSTNTLNNITLQVFYLDMNNNLKPLSIGQDFIGSVKLHFKKIF